MRADGRNMQRVDLTTIDHDRVFLPPVYTQLYYTSLWSDLDRRHRLRYSQLYALRTNEVIVMFERFLVKAIVPALARRLEAMSLPRFRQLLLAMLQEEEDHDAVFVALNRACRPDLYADTDFFFFPPSLPVRSLIAGMGHSARWLAYPLWLVFLVEESSLAMARDLEDPGPEPDLGSAEPNWLAVYRLHSRDERRHTLIDRLVLETGFANRGRLARRIDAFAFERILKAIMFPDKHGIGVRVVDQLVRDYPELAHMRSEMVKQIVALNRNPRFLGSLFSQRLVPRVWKLFHGCPELECLGDWIPDYA